MSEMEDIIEILEELQEDSTVSKNIKTKLSMIQEELRTSNKQNLSLKVNKCISELEELTADINLPMDIRTQLIQISSMLEMLS